MATNVPVLFGLPIDLGTSITGRTVSASISHTCVRLNTNQVKCFGEGLNGRLGQGNTLVLGDGAGEMGDNLAPIDL